jgi:tRNA pseudouridine13 synthase
MDSLKLPYATPRLSGIGGRIRELCEDFIVEEIPVYEPEGAGEHLFVNMTRRDMSTRDVQEGSQPSSTSPGRQSGTPV